MIYALQKTQNVMPNFFSFYSQPSNRAPVWLHGYKCSYTNEYIIVGSIVGTIILLMIVLVAWRRWLVASVGIWVLHSFYRRHNRLKSMIWSLQGDKPENSTGIVARFEILTLNVASSGDSIRQK